VWIEISNSSEVKEMARSPSTRRVWIEIFAGMEGTPGWSVTLHPEGVD